MRHLGRWVAYHVVNYNDDRPRRGVDHRRLVVYVGDVGHVDDDVFAPAVETSLEWVVGAINVGCAVRVNDDCEDQLKLTVQVPGLSLFANLGARALRSLAKRLIGLEKSDGGGHGYQRELALRVHDGRLWWMVWADPSGWTNSRPRWREGNLDLAALFLGKEKRDEDCVLDDEVIDVPMPEGVYPTRIQLFETVRRRPRWFTERRVWANATPCRPIPFPSKHGGDDALYEMSCPAKTVYQAVGAVVVSVLTDRRRHGGPDWRPEAAKAGGGA